MVVPAVMRIAPVEQGDVGGVFGEDDVLALDKLARVGGEEHES